MVLSGDCFISLHALRWSVSVLALVHSNTYAWFTQATVLVHIHSSNPVGLLEHLHRFTRVAALVNANACVVSFNRLLWFTPAAALVYSSDCIVSFHCVRCYTPAIVSVHSIICVGSPQRLGWYIPSAALVRCGVFFCSLQHMRLLHSSNCIG